MRKCYVEAAPLLAGDRRLEASAILYFGMRCGLGVVEDNGFVLGIAPLRGFSSDMGFGVWDVSLLDVECVGVPSVSVGVSLLRCCGVGVSGVDGGLSFEVADGVLTSPLDQSSALSDKFAGVLAVEEAATSSSEERLVCENEGEVIMLGSDIPSPSILAAASSISRSSLSGCVFVAEGTLKSSWVSDNIPVSDVWVTVKSAGVFTAAGPLHSGCGNLPMMLSRPVPALAHSQIPLREGVRCSPLLTPSTFSPPSSITVLLCCWRDTSSKLCGCSSGAGRDSDFSNRLTGPCSCWRFCRSGGVTFRSRSMSFSLSFVMSRLGG